MKQPLNIVITTGEPAGIGPELTIKVLKQLLIAHPFVHFTVLGDEVLLAERAQLIGINWNDLKQQKNLTIVHHSLVAPSLPGRLDVLNVPYVLTLLDEAIKGAQAGKYDAIVTAPLQKSIINEAGIAFIGHTEYFAEKTQTKRVVMMLASIEDHPLRVALATTHLALRDVPDAITPEVLMETLQVINQDLKDSFGLVSPKILVSGLNPHAGENGFLGREEIEIIQPVIADLNAQGFNLEGPLPADTLFQPRYLKTADCVLVMYHDQGLPVLKYATFGAGVNVSLGLPIIRTSVDHGTALNLAGTGKAHDGSFKAAVQVAIEMAMHRQKAGNKDVI